MPSSFLSSFPGFSMAFDAMRISTQNNVTFTNSQHNAVFSAMEILKQQHKMAWKATKQFCPPSLVENSTPMRQMMEQMGHSVEQFLLPMTDCWMKLLASSGEERKAELEFLNFLANPAPPQDWSHDYDDTNVLLDLPGLRLIDLSKEIDHKIENYTVVFAPRAGHHSNIAEKVALHMRDNGLSRMAIVEQKCCEEIPLMVNGKRHEEGFDGQVEQYRHVLERLYGITNKPSHLVGICQPGPLLAATLILNPHLGKTFGSAGSPMDTEGEEAFLTDFSRMMGEQYIDVLLGLFGRTIGEEHEGSGRKSYDGSAHVLGFYLMGFPDHMQNFSRLLEDLKSGNEKAAKRQKEFYDWYNTVHHFPAGFIRDTYKKIFVNNELARGNLTIGDKKIGYKDYPGSVPIWAIAGKKDNIAPPGQALGHLDNIDSLNEFHKLSILSEGGHMGLFRSQKILETDYAEIVDFMLCHSNFI